jgi:hypothetical protein
MIKKYGIITRRDFLRTGSYAVMGGLMGLPVLSNASAGKITKSKVVLIRDSSVVDGTNLRSHILEEMLDQAVTRLFGDPDVNSAWKQLVGPKDIVGIKSNAWYLLPTPAALEDAIATRVMEAGVKEENISIDDRGIRRNSVFKNSTALINIRPMRTHHWSGLGTLLKNYIMFVSQPWMYHGNACERLATIWQKPEINGKTRLNVLVMLTPLFHGVGPHHFSRRHVWPYGGLIVSTDPVAADATGARIIQSKRHEYFGEDKPISPPPRHIEAADIKFKLGNSHPDRIDLIKIGWQKDLLI